MNCPTPSTSGRNPGMQETAYAFLPAAHRKATYHCGQVSGLLAFQSVEGTWLFLSRLLRFVTCKRHAQLANRHLPFATEPGACAGQTKLSLVTNELVAAGSAEGWQLQDADKQ